MEAAETQVPASALDLYEQSSGSTHPAPHVAPSEEMPNSQWEDKPLPGLGDCCWPWPLLHICKGLDHCKGPEPAVTEGQDRQRALFSELPLPG